MESFHFVPSYIHVAEHTDDGQKPIVTSYSLLRLGFVRLDKSLEETILVIYGESGRSRRSQIIYRGTMPSIEGR
jgi:hypothetical protein